MASYENINNKNAITWTQNETLPILSVQFMLFTIIFFSIIQLQENINSKYTYAYFKNKNQIEFNIFCSQYLFKFVVRVVQTKIRLLFLWINNVSHYK